MRISLVSSFITFLLISALSFGQVIKPVLITIKPSEKMSYTKIYLDTLAAKGTAEFVSADVKTDGSYIMSVPISDPNLYKLRFDQTNFMWLILTPGEKITITPTGSKLGPDATVKGSHHTELLYSALRKSRTFDLKRDSLNKAYNNVQSLPAHDSLSAIIIRDFTANDSIQKVTLMNLVEKEPGSLAWMFFTDKFDITNDFAFVDVLDKALTKAYPVNAFVKQYHEQVEMERKTAIGQPAPDITLPDADGNMRSLSSLKGKVVLLDFWASWCGPCRKENPYVVNVYNKYHEKGFEIFSVSLDKDRNAWLKAIAADNLSWPDHVSDLKYWRSEGAAIYGVTAIPFSVLIDREGRIVAKKLRGDALENKVSELLK
jgi:peroxiredoxin